MHVYGLWVTIIGTMIIWKTDPNITKSKRKGGQRQSAISPKRDKTLKFNKKYNFEGTTTKMVLL